LPAHTSKPCKLTHSLTDKLPEDY